MTGLRFPLKMTALALIICFSFLLASGVSAEELKEEIKVGNIIWVNDDEILFELITDKERKPRKYYDLVHPTKISGICKYIISRNEYRMVYNKKMSEDRLYFLEPTGKREIYFDNDNFHLVIKAKDKVLFDRSFKEFCNSIQGTSGVSEVTCTLSRPDIIVFRFINYIQDIDCSYRELRTLAFSFHYNRHVVEIPFMHQSFPVSRINNDAFMLYRVKDWILISYNLKPYIVPERHHDIKADEILKGSKVDKIANISKMIVFMAIPDPDNSEKYSGNFLCTESVDGNAFKIIDRNVEDFDYTEKMIVSGKKSDKGFQLTVFNTGGEELLQKTVLENDAMLKGLKSKFLISPDQKRIILFHISNDKDRYFEGVKFIDISGIEKYRFQIYH